MVELCQHISLSGERPKVRQEDQVHSIKDELYSNLMDGRVAGIVSTYRF